MWAAIQNMGIEHRGLDVFVAESFLDRADIVAVRQQVCGKGMPKGVTVRFMC
jgi:hypothetical protein